MKVLLIGDYPPPYGGIAVQLSHLARALPEAGVECRVLNIGRSRTVPSVEYESVRSPLDFLAKLARSARSNHLLHLFTNGENWKSWGVALTVGLMGRFARTPVIVTITSGGTPAYIAGARWWVRAVVGCALRFPTALVCRNDAIRQSVSRWRSAGLHVMPAFSAARLRPRDSVPTVVAAFAAAHRPLLVSVVILRPEYDLPTLLEAFRDLRKDWPSAGLVIVGGGEDEAKVRELIGLWKLDDSVLLAGWVPHDACLAIIRAADTFARTTLYDGDASSVREALALGVPVVATATDYRPPGARLVPPGNGEALLEAIRSTLSTMSAKQPQAFPGGFDGDEPLLALYRSVWDRPTGKEMG